MKVKYPTIFRRSFADTRTRRRGSPNFGSLLAQDLPFSRHDFGQVLQQERLRQAHLLIIGSRHRGTINLGEVAYCCGFGSQSNFSVSYKKRFGIAPRRTPLAAE